MVDGEAKHTTDKLEVVDVVFIVYARLWTDLQGVVITIGREGGGERGSDLSVTVRNHTQAL